jgi:1-acyl-sn-glycerol-3-phosphate acyltransferase
VTEIDRLTRLNAAEAARAFVGGRLPRIGRLLELLFRPAARGLSRLLLEFDRRMEAEGFAAASRWILAAFVRHLEIRDGEGVPLRGPLVIASNHPGQTDVFAALAAIPRGDLAIVAADRPILHALRALGRRIIWVPDEPGLRTRVMREALGHLSRGGAILTFPSGAIEPDPAIHCDAVDALKSWSESIAVLARLVPGTRILPVVVSGVLDPRTLRGTLPRLYRDRRKREWVAATLQVMLRRCRRVVVRVDVGRPISAPASGSRSSLLCAVTDEAADLMRRASGRPRLGMGGIMPAGQFRGSTNADSSFSLKPRDL